jgi:hypothetical protein
VLAVRQQLEAEGPRAANPSIVVSTCNKAEDIALVVGPVAKALPGTAWEIVFVDWRSIRDWLSLRFLLFALVGSTGLIAHWAALRQGLAFGLGV